MRQLTLVSLVLALVAPAGASAASCVKPKVSWTDGRTKPVVSWTDGKRMPTVSWTDRARSRS